MVKNNILIFLLLFSSFFHQKKIICLPIDGKAIMRAMAAHKSPRIFLLSYPRSGNTWMRYCIEVLTQRPTASFNLNPKIQALPIGCICEYPLNFKKPPVWKIHGKYELNFAGYRHNPKKDLLIFLIRNPKEAIIRQVGFLSEINLVNLT
ncbi:MAG: hypothetical protein K2X90_03995 [Candidatus Babeliaceae bacterium]|nr:hypothetical protein [Candidatus Babeliaceae bacterium]